MFGTFLNISTIFKNFSPYLGYLESTGRRNGDIYILDTSNPQEYSWITYFDPKNLPNSSHTDTPTELTPDEKAIMSKEFWVNGSIVGGVLGFVLSVIFVIYLRQCDLWHINDD